MSGREQQLKGKKWAEGGAATDGRGWRHVIKSVGALSGSRGRPQGQDTSWRCHSGGWETEGAATERNGRCGVKRPDQMSSEQAASFSGCVCRDSMSTRMPFQPARDLFVGDAASSPAGGTCSWDRHH